MNIFKKIINKITKPKWFVIQNTDTNTYLNKNPYRWVYDINNAMAFKEKDAKKEIAIFLTKNYKLIPVNITIKHDIL